MQSRLTPLARSGEAAAASRRGRPRIRASRPIGGQRQHARQVGLDRLVHDPVNEITSELGGTGSWGWLSHGVSYQAAQRSLTRGLVQQQWATVRLGLPVAPRAAASQPSLQPLRWTLRGLSCRP